MKHYANICPNCGAELVFDDPTFIGEMFECRCGISFKLADHEDPNPAEIPRPDPFGDLLVSVVQLVIWAFGFVIFLVILILLGKEILQFGGTVLEITK